MSEQTTVSPSFEQAEEWRPIRGFSDYQVSTLGRFKSRRPPNGRGAPLSTWRQINPNRLSNGYLRVTLGNGRVCANRTMHQLVLETFVGERPKGMETRHLDGNRANNRLDNLCWGSKKENAADRIRHGTQGYRPYNSKLTPPLVQEIRRLRQERVSSAEVAERFGVSVECVSNATHGRTHSRLAFAGSCWEFCPKLLGELISSLGITIADVARRSGLHYSHIHRTLHGKKNLSWKSIQQISAAFDIDPHSICVEVPMRHRPTTRGRHV